MFFLYKVLFFIIDRVSIHPSTALKITQHAVQIRLMIEYKAIFIDTDYIYYF